MKPLILLLALLTLLGCDRNKAERANLKPMLDEKRGAMLTIETRLGEIDSRLSRTRLELDNSRNELRQNNTEYEKNKLELAKYCMDNKAAVIAIMSTGGGIAIQLADDVPQEAKGVGGLAALFGGGYCLMNMSECADATTHLAYFGSQMSGFKDKADACEKRIQTQISNAEAIEQERQPMAAMLAQARSETAAMQEQYDSLVCKGIFCW